MNHHNNNNNNIITVATVSIFIIVFLCCKCSGDSHIHSGHGRLRRNFFSSISFDDTNEDEQRCAALCHEYSCRREYIQTRTRFFLSCFSDLRQYPCARHKNGTLCEVLVQRYFTRNHYNNNYGLYPYPNYNRSCSYSECSIVCSMILQQLKDTWGCCFHEMAQVRGWQHRYDHNIGFTTNNHSHNYWLSCGIQPPEKCHYDITDITIDLAECSTMEQHYHLYTEYVCVSLPQFLREAKSCAYLYYHASALCAIKDGKRCQELQLSFSNYTRNLFAKAGQDCSRTSDICSLGCKSTLQFLRDHVGCCLNVINGTNIDSIESIYLRYGLWKSCGIEPPGQCASITTRLQPGSGYHPVHGGLLSTVMVFIIIALFLY